MGWCGWGCQLKVSYHLQTVSDKIESYKGKFMFEKIIIPHSVYFCMIDGALFRSDDVITIPLISSKCFFFHFKFSEHYGYTSHNIRNKGKTNVKGHYNNLEDSRHYGSSSYDIIK